LGNVYFRIATGGGLKAVPAVVRNIGFLMKTVPFASKKAEEHLNKSLEAATEIGARAAMGIALLDLGLLYRAKGRKDQAKKCISKAIEAFEECEATGYLKLAKEALEELG